MDKIRRRVPSQDTTTLIAPASQCLEFELPSSPFLPFVIPSSPYSVFRTPSPHPPSSPSSILDDSEPLFTAEIFRDVSAAHLYSIGTSCQKVALASTRVAICCWSMFWRLALSRRATFSAPAEEFQDSRCDIDLPV